MEIIHHIGFNTTNTKDLFQRIFDLGCKLSVVKLPGNGGNIVTFDISESDPRWSVVFKYLKDNTGFDIYHGGDQYDTYFSDEEIRGAEWLRLVPTYYEGYPYPRGSWPYKTFSLTSVCETCAIYNQPYPMQFYKEPGLRNNSFMRFYYTGELFATPEVFSKLKSIGANGYEAWNAIIHNTGEPSIKVAQLHIPVLTKPGLLDIDLMRKVTCQKCGITKYYAHVKGIMRFKRETIINNTDFMLSHEWFGLGLNSFREIIVSNRVAKLILENKWKGVRFKVVVFE